LALHSAKVFAKYVATLPATTLVEQWEAHVAKIGGKVFALCGDNGGHITFKVTEMSFEGLTLIEGIGQAPYFAKRAWVSVSKGAAISDADLKSYIAASQRLVAKGLTKKLRAELGISDL
jgi:predicted DNA-binding protein (MmcQ/YjbR family)